MWLNEKNYNEKTRGLFAAISRFPLNYFVPNYLRGIASNYIENVYPLRSRKKFFDNELIEKAKEVIKLLSVKLSDSNYFNSPTAPNEIDALIFGYLAMILKLQLPNLNNLQQSIMEHQNLGILRFLRFKKNSNIYYLINYLLLLVLYVNRIINEYFPEVDKKKDKSKDDLKVDNFEKASWKSIAFVSLFAVASNILYVLYMIGHDDESDEEEE